MFESNLATWRLAEEHDELLHQALVLRDVLGLIGIGPPPLSRLPTQRPVALNQWEWAGLAAQWQAWWAVTLRHVIRAQRGPQSSPADDWAESLALERERVGIAPDFEGLQPQPQPQLQRAARLLFNRAMIKSDGSAPGRTDALLDWATIAVVARDVSSRRGVSLDRLNAVVLVLDVEGQWWDVPEPGVVLCSTGAASENPVTVLRLAFNSAGGR